MRREGCSVANDSRAMCSSEKQLGRERSVVNVDGMVVGWGLTMMGIGG